MQALKSSNSGALARWCTRKTRHWDVTPKLTASVTGELREDGPLTGMGRTSDVSRVYGLAEYLSPVALSLLFSPYQPGAAVAMTC